VTTAPEDRDTRSLAEELYAIADELRGVAAQGLKFAETHYDTERYQRILAATGRIIAALERRPAEEVLERLQGNLWHVSPLVGAEAALWRDGKLLLIRRADDGRWAVPGGLTEIGETMAETACRELWEETGVRARATRLLGVFDSRLWQSRLKVHLYHVVFEVEWEAGAPAAGPETTSSMN
jgi:ADP-ribose pyrophosphatase YjhB (NUDIX family)